MDLSAMMKALETAPKRMKALIEGIEARQRQAKTIEFFLEAVRLLRVSWKDEDPGKYTAHWHCFKGDRKVWPRELVDADAVAKHVLDRRTRRPHWADYDVPLAEFAELRREDCPACGESGLMACSYQQTYDSPGGDEWSKIIYVLCAPCLGLYRLSAQTSDGRF